MSLQINFLAFVTVTGFILISCGQQSNHQKGSETSTSTVKIIEDSANSNKQEVIKLDESTYEILETEHFPAAENYHVLLKSKKVDKASLQDFVDKFRAQYCSKNCNISLYDDASVKPLVKKYPLEGDEYLRVADHLIGQSIFEIPEVDLYPYQDIKYKELGGRNWKKEPIK